MRFEEVLCENAAGIPQKTVVGIDIGSRQAKAVLLKDRNIYTALIPTGFKMQQSAEDLLKKLYEQADMKREDIDYIVVTGYGRIALKFEDIPYQMVTEIACHGMGAHYLAEGIRTIVDIGGQDSKAISIDPENGKVIQFAMNDKCAAGTGRFLEKIATVLEYDVTEIGEASLHSKSPAKIDSTCVVFAESEVVSSRAKGIPAEDIAAGIHLSVANRVSALLKRVGIESNVLFTGGVSNNIGMRKAFEDTLNIKISESRLNTVFAGALGAAVFAADFAKRNLESAIEKNSAQEEFRVDFTAIRKRIKEAEESFVNHTAGKKAYVAYTCNYTPVEVLAAANVAYVRLLERGTPEDIIAGETITQSMVCDFAKSIIGGFIKKKPVNKAVEKLYTFFTCGCMRATVEAIGELYVPVGIYTLPRNRQESEAKETLAFSIRAFKDDLEKLTGEKILEDTIHKKVLEFNLARKYIREIAEYRKNGKSLVKSSEFQEILTAYFNVPVDVLIPELENILTQLQKSGGEKTRKPRLLLSGGIVAQGDDKVTRLIEELGAEIVAEDNCTGIKPVSFDVKDDAERDVFENLAEAYLYKAPCSRMNPKEDLLEYSAKLAKEYNVDGVVIYYLKFCPSYSMIEKQYRELFNKLNIPLLILSGDYSVGDEGQIKTRLEAFIEMLEQKRGV